MKIGIVQYDIIWEDHKLNREKIDSIINAGISSKSQLDWLIFPEMSLSGFSMNIEKTVLSLEDEGFFRNLAQKWTAFVTYGGVKGNNNRSITIDSNGNSVYEYSKIHLFSYADEDKYYSPGCTHNSVLLSGVCVVPLICYDLRFPYLFWKKAIEADVFVVIANWPESRISHWNALLKARAIENQAYVIGVNRIGSDSNVVYCGNSMVIDPMGNILLDCGNNEGIFVHDLDKEVVTQTRKKLDFLNDRRE